MIPGATIAPTWTEAQFVKQLAAMSPFPFYLTIPYNFVSTATVNNMVATQQSHKNEFAPLTKTQITAAEDALKFWDDLIAPSIGYNTNGGNTTGIWYAGANFLYEFNEKGEFLRNNNGSVYQDFAYDTYNTVKKDFHTIWFNNSYKELLSPSTTIESSSKRYAFETFLHETGHALGLDHAGNYNAAPNVDPTPSHYKDSTVYSIMSYFGPQYENKKYDPIRGMDSVEWADWYAREPAAPDGKASKPVFDVSGFGNLLCSPQTPMLYDVLAIQKLYGADTTTRTGNTTYGFNSTVSPTDSKIFNFIKNKYPVITIYDAGGKDTLDLSGWKAPCKINLEQGTSTDCNYMTKNIWIAYGVLIENARGGGGDDTLSGNSVGNKLEGLDGDDFLYGKLGDDFLVGGLGADRLVGGEDADTFIYKSCDESCRSNGVDIIKDFERGTDKIDLSSIDANRNTPAFEHFKFVTSSKFSNAGELRFSKGFLLGNTDLNITTNEIEIELAGVTAFGKSDLIL